MRSESMSSTPSSPPYYPFPTPPSSSPSVPVRLSPHIPPPSPSSLHEGSRSENQEKGKERRDKKETREGREVPRRASIRAQETLLAPSKPLTLFVFGVLTTLGLRDKVIRQMAFFPPKTVGYIVKEVLPPSEGMTANSANLNEATPKKEKSGKIGSLKYSSLALCGGKGAAKLKYGEDEDDNSVDLEIEKLIFSKRRNNNFNQGKCSHKSGLDLCGDQKDFHVQDRGGTSVLKTSSVEMEKSRFIETRAATTTCRVSGEDIQNGGIGDLEEFEERQIDRQLRESRANLVCKRREPIPPSKYRFILSYKSSFNYPNAMKLAYDLRPTPRYINSPQICPSISCSEPSLTLQPSLCLSEVPYDPASFSYPSSKHNSIPLNSYNKYISSPSNSPTCLLPRDSMTDISDLSSPIIPHANCVSEPFPPFASPSAPQLTGTSATPYQTPPNASLCSTPFSHPRRRLRGSELLAEGKSPRSEGRLPRRTGGMEDVEMEESCMEGVRCRSNRRTRCEYVSSGGDVEGRKEEGAAERKRRRKEEKRRHEHTPRLLCGQADVSSLKGAVGVIFRWLLTSRGGKIGALLVHHRYHHLCDLPFVIFSHGNATDIGYMFPQLLTLAIQSKCNVLSYEYTGYGLSSGVPSEKNTYADIRAAYCFATQTLKVQPSQIILYGQSVGSGPSCYLAADKERLCCGLILHSPIASGVRLLLEDLHKSPFFDCYKNIDRVKDVSCPIFFLHGIEDSQVPHKHSQILYESALASRATRLMKSRSAKSVGPLSCVRSCLLPFRSHSTFTSASDPPPLGYHRSCRSESTYEESPHSSSSHFHDYAVTHAFSGEGNGEKFDDSIVRKESDAVGESSRDLERTSISSPTRNGEGSSAPGCNQPSATRSESTSTMASLWAGGECWKSNKYQTKLNDPREGDKLQAIYEQRGVPFLDDDLQLWLVEGADHNDIEDREPTNYYKKVHQFLTKCMRGSLKIS